MIYFIQDEASLAIKIGFTNGDPEERLKTLQTGCPGKLWLIHTTPGDQAFEKDLHDRFAQARVNGEWFRPVPAILWFVVATLKADSAREKFNGFRDAVRMLDNWIDQFDPKG